MYTSKQKISTPFRVFTGERNQFLRLPEAHVQKHIVQWSSFLLAFIIIQNYALKSIELMI